MLNFYGSSINKDNVLLPFYAANFVPGRRWFASVDSSRKQTFDVKFRVANTSTSFDNCCFFCQPRVRISWALKLTTALFQNISGKLCACQYPPMVENVLQRGQRAVCDQDKCEFLARKRIDGGLLFIQ